MAISLYLNFKLSVAAMEMEMAPPPPPSAVSLSPSSYQPTLSPPLRYRRPLYPAATPPPSTAAATANACRNSTGPMSDAGGVVLVGSYRGERGPVQMGDGFEDQIWGFDDDCNQTGQMVAGLLNWLQETFASKLSDVFWSGHLNIISVCSSMTFWPVSPLPAWRFLKGFATPSLLIFHRLSAFIQALFLL